MNQVDENHMEALDGHIAELRTQGTAWAQLVCGGANTTPWPNKGRGLGGCGQMGGCRGEC